MTQCALAWSWITLPLPGLQTSISYSRCQHVILMLYKSDNLVPGYSRTTPWFLPGRPTHQVTLPIPLIDKIPRIRPASIPQGIRRPLTRLGGITLHQALDIEWIDIIGIKPRAGPQCGAEVLDELLECRVGGRSGRLVCEGWRRCRAVFDIRHVDKYDMVRLWCGIGMSWSYRCNLGVLIKYGVLKLGV